MRIFYHSKFKKSFQNCSQEIKEKFYKQAKFLLNDLRHPSLDAKKYDEAKGI